MVGMLIYLTRSTRPNITFAVHQCARFYHVPKRSHEAGLNHITRYLEGACTQGLMMTLDTNNLELDLFADTDLQGRYPSQLWKGSDILEL